MKRYIALCFLLISYVLSAQELTVEVPSVVAKGEPFRVVFTADGNLKDFQWEPGGDFDIAWGPQTGSSSSTRIINGKRETSHTESRTYLLTARAIGTFTISPASAKVGGKACTTQAVKVEVVEEEKPAANAAQGSQSASDPAVTGSISDEDVFMRFSVTKSNVMKGEPLNAELKLYVRGDISGFENVEFPSFDGFWSKETFTPQNIEFTRENVGGKIFNTAVLRRYMLIPQQEGKLVISPARLVCQMRVRMASQGPRSIFDDFFDSYQTIRKRVETDAVTINVKSLPAGAPASFAGGVGQFNITARFNRDSISANEAASLQVTVSGSGNISMLEAPKIDFPSDFEVYDIKTTENIAATGTSGSKTFEYPIIPRSYGDFKVGPISYSYYDVNKGGYVTISEPELTLKVLPSSEQSSAGVLVPGAMRQSVRDIGQDIRYIAASEGALAAKGKFFVTSPLFYILVLLIVVLYFVVCKVLSAVSARRADVAGTRNRQANRMARGRLRQAADFLSKGLETAFYEELHRAVLGYVSDKLSISAADLSKESVSRTLAARNVPQSQIDELMQVLEECEMARYSPDNTAEAMEKLYQKAVEVISAIEGSIKRGAAASAKGRAAGAVVLMLALMPAFANAQDVKALWGAAADSYAAGEYEAALGSYLQIEQADKVSAELYYNIGNAYYKLGDLPHSILYYERALKIRPAFDDARHNLATARGAVLDKIETVPEFMVAMWLRSIRHSLSSDGWAVLALALLLVTAVLMIGFKAGGSSALRKTCFIVACVTMLFALISFGAALHSRSEAASARNAIVMQSVTSVKSSPAAEGKSLFILHEGTKVSLLDNVGSFVKIEISDGRQGWLPEMDIEVI